MATVLNHIIACQVLINLDSSVNSSLLNETEQKSSLKLTKVFKSTWCPDDDEYKDKLK